MIAPRGPMVAIVGVSALLLVVAVLSAWTGTRRLIQRGDDGAGAKAAAVAFVEAYGTFDSRSAADYTSRLATLATGDLREGILAARVDAAAGTQHLEIASETTAVSVSSLSRDNATISLVVMQRRSREEPVSGARFEEAMEQHVFCDLVREGGRWLASGLRLASQQPAGAASPR